MGWFKTMLTPAPKAVPATPKKTYHPEFRLCVKPDLTAAQLALALSTLPPNFGPLLPEIVLADIHEVIEMIEPLYEPTGFAESRDGERIELPKAA